MPPKKKAFKAIVGHDGLLPTNSHGRLTACQSQTEHLDRKRTSIEEMNLRLVGDLSVRNMM